jgi:hypothetical protein
MTPGSIVQCRNREWVLLPSDQEDLLLLRPLTGATDEGLLITRELLDRGEIKRLCVLCPPYLCEQ